MYTVRVGGVPRLAVMLVASMLAFCAASAAHAQTPPQGAPIDQAAREVFVSGQTAFGNGDYETALQRFRQAYELSPRPQLLYNIATALDRLRRDSEALEALRRYLEAQPDASNRTEVEARIRVLERAVAAAQEQAQQQAQLQAQQQQEQAQQQQQQQQQDAQAAAAATGNDQTDRGSSGGMSPVPFFIGAGLTAVAAGLTVYFGLSAKSKNSDYEAAATRSGATFNQVEGLYNSAHDAQTMTNVFIGVSAGLAVTSAVLFFLTDWSGGGSEPAASSSGSAQARTEPIFVAGPQSILVGAVHSF